MREQTHSELLPSFSYKKHKIKLPKRAKKGLKGDIK
nr:MAG TPA: hypothetical protein [Bacteriophage sp.]